MTVPVYNPQIRYSPMQAIKKHCLTCVGGNRKMLACCGGEKTCFLYRYRYGHRPQEDSVENEPVGPRFSA